MKECLKGRAELGVYGELIAATFLQRLGYQVFLSVGSHGPADVVARRNGKTRAFDVKICRTTVTGKARKDKSLQLTKEQKRDGVELFLVSKEGEVVAWGS